MQKLLLAMAIRSESETPFRTVEVSIGPGYKTVTPIPSRAISHRSDSEKARIAAFEDAYAVLRGYPTQAKQLDMLRICPSACSRRKGRKTLQLRTSPKKLTCITRSKSLAPKFVKDAEAENTWQGSRRSESPFRRLLSEPPEAACPVLDHSAGFPHSESPC